MRITPLSPSARKAGKNLMFSLALGLLSGTTQAQTLVTGFEESEGFPPGGIVAGKQGWEGSTASQVKNRLFISTEESHDGSSSLVAKGSAGTYTFSRSPNLYSLGYTGISFMLKNPSASFSEPNQPIARWEVSFGDNDDQPDARIVLQLRYSTAKAYHLHLSSTTDATLQSGNRNILPASALNLVDWNKFSMQFDFAEKTLTIMVNGARVSNVIRLNPEKVSEKTKITSIRFSTLPGEAAGDTFFDTVEGTTH